MNSRNLNASYEYLKFKCKFQICYLQQSSDYSVSNTWTILVFMSTTIVVYSVFHSLCCVHNQTLNTANHRCQLHLQVATILPMLPLITYGLLLITILLLNLRYSHNGKYTKLVGYIVMHHIIFYTHFEHRQHSWLQILNINTKCKTQDAPLCFHRVLINYYAQFLNATVRHSNSSSIFLNFSIHYTKHLYLYVKFQYYYYFALFRST